MLGEHDAVSRRSRKQILKQDWVKPNKRIFDNAKISDHFAIIPTLQTPKHLTEAERSSTTWWCGASSRCSIPAAEYLRDHAHHARRGEHSSRPKARCWSSPAGSRSTASEAQDEDANLRAGRSRARRSRTDEVDVDGARRPSRRARYTEATLLSAMEGAGKLIEDDELREAMREKGLGTPATRAAIIEGLITRAYMHREGRELVPTAKAFSLMTLLRGLGVEELTSPELTGEWEYKLAQMEHGKLTRDEFMSEIVEMTEHIVAQAKSTNRDTIPGDYATLHGALPEVRRRGAGELHASSSARSATSRSGMISRPRVDAGRGRRADHASARSAR